ncbi:MAG: class D sortase [Longicatena sp.]
MKQKIIVVIVSIGVIIGLLYMLKETLNKQYMNAKENSITQRSKSVANMVSIIDKREIVLLKKNINLPVEGTKYATIQGERVNFNKDLYYGDSDSILDIAIGQYTKSGLPGEGKPILIAGHNGTHFYKLREMKIDDIVTITTTYGTYHYKINNVEIKHVDDFSTSVLNDDKEYLIMYTCYPFEEYVHTDQRYFVYAQYVDGPKLRGEAE